jgi:hypothetical protein
METEQKFIPPTPVESAKSNVWAQLETNGKPVEPIAAYEIFLLYCEMDAPRSLRNLEKEKGVKVAVRTLERYSAKYSWQTRAFAYDRYVAALEQNARDVARFNLQKQWTERRETLRLTEWNLGEKLIERGKEMIDDESIKGNLNDAVRCFDLANKLQRHAVDAETDRIVFDAPVARRHSDVLKARAAFAKSAELFPDIGEGERARAVAHAYGVTVSEIVAAEEILTSIVQENVSELVS